MSRLKLPAAPLEKEALKVGPHLARRVADAVLVTNEAGEHAWLTDEQYASYLAGKPASDELVKKDLVRDQLDFANLRRRAMARHLLDWKGPNVHTVVVTLRCNFRCLYCHASVVDPSRADMDMTPDTARRVVDTIFQSGSPTLMIEFQGGEPLLNWPVIKLIVKYAREKNRTAKRALHFGLISNFSLLDYEKLDFLIEHGVSFCTSLDGPAEVHNRNRVYLGGNTHSEVTGRLRMIQEKRKTVKLDPPNAICTVTRHSLPHARAIVDQLIDLGIERVQLGPLDPIGFAKKSWDSIGYTSAEFVKFYEEALDYVIERSAAGAKIYEKTALILLIRILRGSHWRFPNADAVARLAYNWDGGIYTCEEGRLLANEGDDFFKIGQAGQTTLAEALDHPTVRASLLAAQSDSQPMCSQCAYNPFCTVLPVYNQQTQGSVFGRMPDNGWCEKMMGLFDAVFARLKDPAKRKTLESWLEYADR